MDQVRIRRQASPTSSPKSSTDYTCDFCSFTTARLNVIIQHRKTHSAAETPKQTGSYLLESYPFFFYWKIELKSSHEYSVDLNILGIDLLVINYWLRSEYRLTDIRLIIGMTHW